MLTSLQRRVALLLSELSEADGFALGGGAALIAHGLVERETRDLDFFTTQADEVAALLPVLEERLRGDGLTVARIREMPGFVRLEISDEQETVELDLAHESASSPSNAPSSVPRWPRMSSLRTRCWRCTAAQRFATSWMWRRC